MNDTRILLRKDGKKICYYLHIWTLVYYASAYVHACGEGQQGGIERGRGEERESIDEIPRFSYL